MTHDEEMKLYNDAIDTWPDIQERQWIEEMAEAIQAFCHWKRNHCSFGDIVTEFAHVEFCIRQFLVKLSRDTGYPYRDLTHMIAKEKDRSFMLLAERLKTGLPHERSER